MTACAPLAASPAPTPEPVLLTLTPALAPLRQPLHDCAIASPALGLAIEEIPAPSLAPQDGLLTLRLGYPVGWQGYTAVLAQETLAPVVHLQNPLQQIDTQTLSRILSGHLTRWEDVPGTPPGLSGAIAVWSYPAGDDLRQSLEAALPDGALLKSANLAPSPQAMLEAVARDPLALGYLPARWLDNTIHSLKMNDSAEANLQVPILALTPDEPQGAARRLLGCLAEKLK